MNYATKFLSELVDVREHPAESAHRASLHAAHAHEHAAHPLDPRVQIVINMDGWGPQWMKLDSYHDYVYLHPVQYTGFKLFYHNDTKKGNTLLTPEQVLKVLPKPVYIQYQ